MTESNSEKYMPSNGTEGLSFIESWCWKCKREQWRPDNDDGERCTILTASYLAEGHDKGPDEWQWNIRTSESWCTAFEAEGKA